MRIKLASVAIALLLLAAFMLAACGQDTATPSSSSTTAPVASSTTETVSTTTSEAAVTTTATTGPDEQAFTLADLAQYDGKDGRPAYVAVDGVVYDVTGSRMWPDGVHGRCELGAQAGLDLSEMIGQAPAAMRSLLAKMPVVGRLAQ